MTDARPNDAIPSPDPSQDVFSDISPEADALVDSTESITWNTLQWQTDTESTPDKQYFSLAEKEDTPRLIDHYEIQEELGRGAFGTVHKAIDRENGRELAIKIFGGRMTTIDSEQRFRREVEMASRLDHPNISSIIDFGTHEGSPYIAMRLIRGLTLDKKIDKDGPLPPAEAARIVYRLGVAIQHAHSRKVIHRDLKPSNVILEQREPVVVDLGLSKSLISADSFTGKGDLLGSPLFMAPEQLFGESVDERCDVFGLGGLLLYLLTGSSPRSLDDFRKRLTPEPKLPREIPSGLSAICSKALAANPDKRFRTAADMSERVQDWMAGREVGLENSKRHLWLAGGVVVLLLAALSLPWLVRKEPLKVVLEKNRVNTLKFSGTELVIKDGRSVFDRQGMLSLPFLKVIVDKRETWSPPRQRLKPEFPYVVGRNLNGFLTVAFSFIESPSPISAKLKLKQWPVEPTPEVQMLELKSGAESDFKGQAQVSGSHLQFQGHLESVDKSGLTWGYKKSEQLRVTFDNTHTWSPPRPSNRTDFGVEYPLGRSQDHIVTARFQDPDANQSVFVRLQIYKIKNQP